MSFVLGITGIIGTGKSLSAEYLAKKYQYKIIYADKVGHQLLKKGSPVYRKILKTFGTVNRKKLAEIVFRDKKSLAKLNKIMHPAMKVIIGREIKSFASKGEPVIIEAALLHQMGLHKLCDQIICLKSSLTNIRKRLLQKGLTPEQIALRLSNVPRIPAQKTLVLNNNGQEKYLKQKLDQVQRRYSYKKY